MFPEEIDTDEPYVIREALNNAIAHQDYTLGGQVNAAEYDDKLVFSNKGSFIPGNIGQVPANDAPKEQYRIYFWATAMVGLKMVDTIGSGIRKMHPVRAPTMRSLRLSADSALPVAEHAVRRRQELYAAFDAETGLCADPSGRV